MLFGIISWLKRRRSIKRQKRLMKINRQPVDNYYRHPHTEKLPENERLQFDFGKQSVTVPKKRAQRDQKRARSDSWKANSVVNSVSDEVNKSATMAPKQEGQSKINMDNKIHRKDGLYVAKRVPQSNTRPSKKKSKKRFNFRINNSSNNDTNQQVNDTLSSLESQFMGTSNGLSSIKRRSASAYESSLRASYASSVSNAREVMQSKIAQHSIAVSMSASRSASVEDSMAQASESASIAASASFSESAQVFSAEHFIIGAGISFADPATNRKFSSCRSALISAQARADLTNELDENVKRQNGIIAKDKMRIRHYTKNLSSANHQLSVTRSALKQEVGNYKKQVVHLNKQVQMISVQNYHYKKQATDNKSLASQAKQLKQKLVLIESRSKELKSILHDVVTKNIKADQTIKYLKESGYRIPPKRMRHQTPLTHSSNAEFDSAKKQPLKQPNVAPKQRPRQTKRVTNRNAKTSPKSANSGVSNNAPSFVKKGVHIDPAKVKVEGRYGAHSRSMSRVSRHQESKALKHEPSISSDRYYQPKDLDGQDVMVVKDFGHHMIGDRLSPVGIMADGHGGTDFIMNNGSKIKADKRYVQLIPHH